MAYLRKVRAVRVVMAYQPTIVIIGALLARAVWITKVGLHAEHLCHSLVISELTAVVQCQRFYGAPNLSQQTNHGIAIRLR